MDLQALIRFLPYNLEVNVCYVLLERFGWGIIHQPESDLVTMNIRKNHSTEPVKHTDYARSVFPRSSTVLRATRRDDGEESDSSALDGSDNDKKGRDKSRGTKKGDPPVRRPIAPGNPSDSSDWTDNYSSSDSLFSSDVLNEEPSSVLTNDSENAKARKRERKKRHRAKLNKIKYQQSFLKKDPPFTYKGEAQVTLFKKWCCELRDWVRHAHKKAIRIAGKYLGGRGYQLCKHKVVLEAFLSVFALLFRCM